MKLHTFLFLIIVYSQCCTAKAQELKFSRVHETANTIYELVKLAPARRITRDPDYRRELARAIIKAADKHQVPELLLTVKVYNESSFKMHVCSSKGLPAGKQTCGLGQMHGVATVGCDLKTRQGQLDCTAKWLQHCYKKCGTWEGALSAYATKNGVCSPLDLRKSWAGVLKFWRTIRRQVNMWLRFEEQREAIRDTIQDDIEHFSYLKENG